MDLLFINIPILVLFVLIFFVKNIKTKEIEHEYKVRNDEKIVYIENTLYIVTDDELKKYVSGEIENFEFDDAAYELEENEIFIFE